MNQERFERLTQLLELTDRNIVTEVQSGNLIQKFMDKQHKEDRGKKVVMEHKRRLHEIKSINRKDSTQEIDQKRVILALRGNQNLHDNYGNQPSTRSVQLNPIKQPVNLRKGSLNINTANTDLNDSKDEVKQFNQKLQTMLKTKS